MDISELLNLTKWIQEEIVSKKVVDKYNNLYHVLGQNSRPNRQQQPIDQQQLLIDPKNELIDTIQNINTNQLTRNQLDFLVGLNIGEYIGKIGVEKIEDILHKNVINMTTSANNIRDIAVVINNGIKKSNQIKEVLSSYSTNEEYELENEVLMRVSFRGNASISNVNDFKKYGREWHDIGRGIAMVCNKAPESIKITGATKGSIILEFNLAVEIAGVFGAIMFSVLKTTEKVLDIRIKTEGLKNLKLKNTDLIQGLEQEAEDQKQDGVKTITENLIEKFKISKTKDAEKIKVLENSIKKLLDFSDNGGAIDFIEPTNKNKSDNKSLEVYDIFPKIRELEEKVKLLENKKEGVN